MRVIKRKERETVSEPCLFELVWLISHGRKYYWLVWCERKILFVAEKVQLISQTSSNKQGDE